MSETKLYSVEELNKHIYRIFEEDFLLNNVFVKGEISKVTYHQPSGHIYFTLKDNNSVLDCLMFAGNAAYLRFKLEPGMEIICQGKVENYVKSGKFSLKVSRIQKAGDGEIAARLEQLKAKFREAGLFDEQYKQPIPGYVKRIGVVTSPTGDAIHDIIKTTKLRNPYVEIVLYPALVQGNGAKESIVKGIECLEQYGVDVIIIGRGGGSIEDLWAFNEEMVVYAIFNCSVPVISAVGHEKNYLVTDLVADYRVSTPTQAAEAAVKEIKFIDEKLFNYESSLVNRMNYVIQRKRLVNEQLKAKIEKNSPRAKIASYKMKNEKQKDALDYLMKRHLTGAKHKMSVQIQRMKSASPLERLSQGMAYVLDEAGERISGVSNLEPGSVINVRMKDGKAVSKIIEIIPGKENE